MSKKVGRLKKWGIVGMAAEAGFYLCTSIMRMKGRKNKKKKKQTKQHNKSLMGRGKK